MEIDPQVGKIYQHYRNKKRYQIIGIARHSETHEELVIYQALYNCEQFGSNPVWARPKLLFTEQVLHEGNLVPRFQLIC